jgi:hypothetical protein
MTTIPDRGMVCFRLEEHDRRRLKAMAAEKGTTVQDLMTDLALKWMEKEDRRITAGSVRAAR